MVGAVLGGEALMVPSKPTEPLCGLVGLGGTCKAPAGGENHNMRPKLNDSTAIIECLSIKRVNFCIA
jgi:hypothetical protein